MLRVTGFLAFHPIVGTPIQTARPPTTIIPVASLGGDGKGRAHPLSPHIPSRHREDFHVANPDFSPDLL